MKQLEPMREAFETAFIDSSIQSNLAYKPQFISNNYKEGKKVLASIEEELLRCDQFFISVAFITMGGIKPLLQTLKELEELNIEVRMYDADKSQKGFHTKGYIFREAEIYRIIVGSANITSNALSINKEWNTKIISTQEGEYAKKYYIVKEQRKIAKKERIPSYEQYVLQPNKMQTEFVSRFRELRIAGKTKALLISATGTGKTYASAFALREENPKKVLFLIHREQIARQAIKSYQKVFGSTKKMGILSGNAKDHDAEYLFSTMQMMAKEEILSKFRKDEFEIIVIDEVHRAGAESYQRIVDYYKPLFLLGMTASPERMDGFDIYKMFDHNIAYEIRLQQALEEDLLCPFHYFVITEIEIDGDIFEDTSKIKKFANLVSDIRVNYIIEKANYFGYSGARVKGLVFCSTKEEARELSNQFNKRDYKTKFLCGEDSQEIREEIIERLTNDERKDNIDYIFTVDIFNEGVDIPEINQVIMLRPTESPTVFVQQLGRGLRKAEGKEYVVILDFIGNYKNNFMIPIALSGDRTYNKDTIRKYVSNGSRMLPGASTIHFDKIAKDSIYKWWIYHK